MTAEMLPLWQPTDGPSTTGREPVAQRTGDVVVTEPRCATGAVNLVVPRARPVQEADPEHPSTKAARSVSETTVIKTRTWVLGAISEHGPITQEALVALAHTQNVKASDQRIRSTVAELRRENKVREHDRLGMTSAKHPASRWVTTDGGNE